MTDHPMRFYAPEISALLDGRMTQVRRPLRVQPPHDSGPLFVEHYHPTIVDRHGEERPGQEVFGVSSEDGSFALKLPVEIGDRIWVQETHSIHCAHGQHRDDGLRWGPWGGLPTAVSPDGTQIAYFRSGFDRCDHGRWRPSTHMPRWASRITLHVTGVRVQRLQDISEADAIAEGVEPIIGVSGVDMDRHWIAFSQLWDRMHGTMPWGINPWVVAYTFCTHLGNIDHTDVRA